MSTLPKIGTVLEHGGRRAVVIGIAGTENRGVMAKQRNVGSYGRGYVTTSTGVHVQLLDTGGLDTLTRAEIAACTVSNSSMQEVLA